MSDLRFRLRASLLDAMLNRGLTVSFIARRLGRKPNTIAELLSGVRPMELEDAADIGAAMALLLNFPDTVTQGD